jgi:hypothetical protein
MRKSFIILLIFAAAFIFASCKGDTGAAGTPASDGPAVMMFQNGVAPYPAWQGITDTEIRQGGAAYNHGSCAGGLTIGYYNQSGFYASRSLIKFDLSTIDPAGAVVTGAYLRVYCASYSGAVTVTAHAVTTNWAAGTGLCTDTTTTNASWNNSATGLAWTTPGGGGDFYAVKASDSVVMMTPGFYTLTLDKATVQSWITNPVQNFGIILKGSDESAYNEINIAPSEVNMENGPRLTVYYRLP